MLCGENKPGEGEGEEKEDRGRDYVRLDVWLRFSERESGCRVAASQQESMSTDAAVSLSQQTKFSCNTKCSGMCHLHQSLSALQQGTEELPKNNRARPAWLSG